MDTFYKSYVSLCASKKKSLSKVAEEIGLSRTAPNGWKKGKVPSEVTLEKLAQYFDVSVEELTGEKKPASFPVGELSEVKKRAWEEIQKMDDETLEKFIRMAKAMLGE